MSTVSQYDRPAHPARRLVRRWRCFADDLRGAAAVEFALIGTLFVMIFCFWIELGLTMLMQTALDNATRDAARLLKTGSVSTSTDFAAALCRDLTVLMNCSAVKYNVVSGTSFGSLSTAVTSDSSNQMTGNQFSPGASGQDVVVQVGYTRTVFLPIVDSILGTNGNILMVSTLAYQNEPY